MAASRKSIGIAKRMPRGQRSDAERNAGRAKFLRGAEEVKRAALRATAPVLRTKTGRKILKRAIKGPRRLAKSATGLKSGM